jgi:HSP20 family protein
MAVKIAVSEESIEPFGHLLGGHQKVQYRYYRFSQSTSWEPPVNIYEDQKRIYICADLAGLEKEEVAVEVADQEIRIHGQRPVPVPCDPLNPRCILRIEINSGSFFRSIRLPSRADMNSTVAKLDKGFLWITVNKQHEKLEV